MPSCAVLGCKTGYVPGKVAFQTFCFPTSNKLKQLWTEKVNRKNWEPNKYSRIFGEDCKEICKLQNSTLGKVSKQTIEKKAQKFNF